jgi:hypothetical protein
MWLRLLGKHLIVATVNRTMAISVEGLPPHRGKLLLNP